MQLSRRSLLTGAAGLGTVSLARSKASSAAGRRPTGAELDRAAARKVLRLEDFRSPVIIDSIRLLKKGGEHFVHVRSKDGAEGISLPNPPRADYLDKILKQLVIPFFIGKDARDLENLLWELYRTRDNYKLYGIALWCPQAWVEFAILDMLGRIAGKPMGALLASAVSASWPKSATSSAGITKTTGTSTMRSASSA
jgi:L-alanine-DL-glutamate epimerase-like enolase superfamily enzyme